MIKVKEKKINDILLFITEQETTKLINKYGEKWILFSSDKKKNLIFSEIMPIYLSKNDGFYSYENRNLSAIYDNQTAISFSYVLIDFLTQHIK